jgi:hypothetical protein
MSTAHCGSCPRTAPRGARPEAMITRLIRSLPIGGGGVMGAGHDRPQRREERLGMPVEDGIRSHGDDILDARRLEQVKDLRSGIAGVEADAQPGAGKARRVWGAAAAGGSPPHPSPPRCPGAGSPRRGIEFDFFGAAPPLPLPNPGTPKPTSHAAPLCFSGRHATDNRFRFVAQSRR